MDCDWEVGNKERRGVWTLIFGGGTRVCVSGRPSARGVAPVHGFFGVHTVTVYVSVRCSCPSAPRSPVFVFVRVYFVHSPNPAFPLSALTRSVCATNRQPYPPSRPRPHAWLVLSHVILCDRACLFLVVQLCFVCVFVFRSSLFNLPWSPVVCSHACRCGRACEYVVRAATLARNPDRNGVKELGR